MHISIDLTFALFWIASWIGITALVGALSRVVQLQHELTIFKSQITINPLSLSLLHLAMGARSKKNPN